MEVDNQVVEALDTVNDSNDISLLLVKPLKAKHNIKNQQRRDMHIYIAIKSYRFIYYIYTI